MPTSATRCAPALWPISTIRSGSRPLAAAIGPRPRDCRGDVGRLLLDRRLGHEPVIGACERPALSGEMRRLDPRPRALVADRPAAAMDEQQQGRAGGVRRNHQVELLLGVGAIGQFARAFGRRGRCAALADRLATSIAELGQGSADAGAETPFGAPAQRRNLPPAFGRQPLALLGEGRSADQARGQRRSQYLPHHVHPFAQNWTFRRPINRRRAEPRLTA